MSATPSAGAPGQQLSDVSTRSAADNNRELNTRPASTARGSELSNRPTYLVLPAQLANLMEGETYGGTIAVNWHSAATR